MIRVISFLRHRLARFAACESGTITVQFVIVFPMFVMFFLMTVEAGIISIRNVMLERGVDIAVRDVRIGRLPNPDKDELIARICEAASIIPDCLNQMQLEMIIRDPRNWVAVDPEVKCIDRSVTVQPDFPYANGANNDLVILRACARFDPFLAAGPMAILGNAIRDNSSTQARGSYALVATSAFAVEPFNKED